MNVSRSSGIWVLLPLLVDPGGEPFAGRCVDRVVGGEVLGEPDGHLLMVLGDAAAEQVGAAAVQLPAEPQGVDPVVVAVCAAERAAAERGDACSGRSSSGRLGPATPSAGRIGRRLANRPSRAGSPMSTGSRY
jgi:hypothetical protein